MKATRKVGDAKKHECTFASRSRKSSSEPPHSKTRVHGLIRSNPPVMFCVRSRPQHDFRTPVVCFPPCPMIYPKSPYESSVRRKGVNIIDRAS